MKSNSYMNRALRSNDRRFANILDRLGYHRRDMIAKPVDDLQALREEYTRIIGKRPYHGWDIKALREKINAALES